MKQTKHLFQFLGELAELVALSEKATQGEFRIREMGRDFFVERPKHGHEAYGIEILGDDDYETKRGDAEFIAALVNWFRTNHASLSDREPATEAVLEKLLINIAACEGPHWENFPQDQREGISRETAYSLGHAAGVLNAVQVIKGALKGKGASQGVAPAPQVARYSHGNLYHEPGDIAKPAPEPSGEFVRVRREDLRMAVVFLAHDEDDPARRQALSNQFERALSAPDEQKG